MYFISYDGPMRTETEFVPLILVLRCNIAYYKIR